MESGKHTVSFQVDETVADHVNALLGAARDNGIKCSDGLVIRAAIMSLQPTPEFFGIIRTRKEYESQRRNEARNKSLKKSRGRTGR